MKSAEQIKYLPFYIVYLLLFIVTANYPFFWDTVQLASKHAHFFYETDFRTIILPNEIDSGHIPFLGIYLAGVWKIFGKTLFVSHAAILPFVMGVVYQSVIMTRRIFSPKWHYYALALILADATLMAQCTLVSPDVLLVFFLLLALNNMLTGKRSLYIIALAGLTLASMRGMMCVAGLFVAEIAIRLINHGTSGWKNNVRFLAGNSHKILGRYLPAIFIASCFFVWHYYKTGWIGYHKDMPWSSLFERAGFKEAVWNSFILAWRLVDFGRVFIWLAGIYALYRYLKERPELPVNFKFILVLFISLFISLAHAPILHRGLSGHRYFLPLYILFTLIVCYYLFEMTTSAFPKKLIFFTLLAGLLVGNFWVYPSPVSTGWDSSLAYLPYFPLRKEMMHYMEKEGIPADSVGTLFPNNSALEYIDLSGTDNSFAQLDMGKNRYVFYSNVFNGFSKQQLAELQNDWKKLMELGSMKVKIILYFRPENR